MAKKNPLQIEITEDDTGVAEREGKTRFRWQIWRSGRRVAISPDSYAKRAQCRRTLVRLIATLGAEDYVWKNGV